MTILDSFFILFESDASKLDKGLADSDKKAKGLQGTLGTADAVAGKLGGSLMGALAGLAGAALAAVSFGTMVAGIKEATAAADHLDETAERLGQTTEFLSAWGGAVKLAGGSVDGFASSLDAFNKQLAQVEVTGKSRAAPFLKELGIDLESVENKGKSAADFLPQLADSFERLAAPQAIALGSRLGLDQATIMTLRRGRVAVEELIAKQKELGVVTTQQGKIAAEFNDELDNTRHAFRSVWLGIMENVLPPLTWMLQKFQAVATFMRKHSDFMVGLFIALGAAITNYVLPPLLSMAATAIVALAPFLLLGAAVAALAVGFALLYDDVANFLGGGDSLFGRFVDWVSSVEVLKAAAGFLGAAFDYVVASIREFVAASPTLQAALQAIATVTGVVSEGLGAVWDILRAIGGIIGSVTSGLGGLIGKGVDATTEALKAGKIQLQAAASSPLAATSSTAISNTRTASKTTSVQIGKVEVQTQAADAAGISKAIGGSMETQMRQAVNNFDDGVLG